MSQFTINITKCRSAANDLEAVGKKLSSCKADLTRILSALNAMNFRYVDAAVKNAIRSTENQHNRVVKLRDTLESCTSVYERTEREITGCAEEPSAAKKAAGGNTFDFTTIAGLLAFMSAFGIIPGSAMFWILWNLFNDNRNQPNGYRIDSILFDDDGQYGGDQGRLAYEYDTDQRRREELLRILREYFPNMTDEEAQRYLENFNMVGCGYVAMANTIFMQYENDPAGFERAFGFPMYDGNGDLNYERLALDLYAHTDLNDMVPNESGTNQPGGTDQFDRRDIMESYLNERGVSVRTENNAHVTPENFREITENGGKVIISLHNDNIYQGNRSYYIDGGHAMTVSGCTDDGKLIVSSWGEEYYIDASELDGNDSFAVIYFE